MTDAKNPTFFEDEYPFLTEKEQEAYNAEMRLKVREKAERMRSYRRAPNATITLEFPINVGGTETSVITMRRPTLSDRLNANATNAGSQEKAELMLFQNLCQLSDVELGRIDLADYTKLQDVLRGFLGSEA